MPATFAAITADRAQAHVVYGSSEVDITYCPSKASEETYAQMQQWTGVKSSEALPDMGKTLNQVLSEMIVSWDLYADEAMSQTWPLDAASIGKLPLFFRLACLRSIFDTLTYDPPTGTLSNEG